MRTLLERLHWVPPSRWRATWFELQSTCLLCLLMTGCAIGPTVAREYLNQPVDPASDSSEGSGAYLASTRVPWCVNLRHPTVTLAKARAFRKAFFTAYGESARKAERANLLAAAGEPGKEEDGVLKGLTCWSAAQKAAGDLGMEVHNQEFLALSLPGGGSRSAIFSASVMFEMQLQKILHKVDLLSSVSGGSLPAALFARSCADEEECVTLYGHTEPLLWTKEREEVIFDLLGTDFLDEEMFQIPLPWDFWLSGTTHDDRIYTTAEVFASNLFSGGLENGSYGMPFRQLNPRRPNLLINAMNSTGKQLGPGLKGQQFLFTLETFEQDLHSNLHDYPLALAVAGSSAFPGVFPPLTLAGYASSDEGHDGNHDPARYWHLVDGGLYDRLGGEAIRVVLEDIVEREKPCIPGGMPFRGDDAQDCLKQVIVVVLDSGLPIEGEDAKNPVLPGRGIKFLLGHTIKMASFALLDVQAELRLDSLKAFAAEKNDMFRREYGPIGDVVHVVDIRLRDVGGCVSNPLPCAEAEGLKELSADVAARMYQELSDRVLRVPLSLRISPENAALLRRAARILVRRKVFEGCAIGSPYVDCTIYEDEDPSTLPDLYTATPSP